jgi:hypothetical protein
MPDGWFFGLFPCCLPDSCNGQIYTVGRQFFLKESQLYFLCQGCVKVLLAGFYKKIKVPTNFFSDFTDVLGYCGALM